jgi:hypothetical protein
MPALVAGIHVLTSNGNEDVDGRDKPGHDEWTYGCTSSVNQSVGNSWPTPSSLALR